MRSRARWLFLIVTLILTGLAAAGHAEELPLLSENGSGSLIWQPGDGPVTFSVKVQSASPFTAQWTKDGRLLAGTTQTSLTIPLPSAATVGRYTINVKNAAGSSSRTYYLACAPAVEHRTLVVNEGGPCDLVASLVAGPVLYHWQVEGTSAVYSPLNGLYSRRLSILKSLDELTWNASVTLPDGTSLIINTFTVALRPRPRVIQNMPSSAMKLLRYQVIRMADYFIYPDETYSNNDAKAVFRAQGLPPGMVLHNAGPPDSAQPDKLVGWVLEGTPTKVGSYPSSITVTTPAGRASRRLDLSVEPLPAKIAGSYSGLVMRSVSKPLGGDVRLTVTSSGSYTGSLHADAGQSASFTGKLKTFVGSDDLYLSATHRITFRDGSVYDLNFYLSAGGAYGTGGSLWSVPEDASALRVFDLYPHADYRSSNVKAYRRLYHALLTPLVPNNLVVENLGPDPEVGGLARMDGLSSPGYALVVFHLADGQVATCTSRFCYNPIFSNQPLLLPARVLVHQGHGVLSGDLLVWSSVHWYRPPSGWPGEPVQQKRFYANGFESSLGISLGEYRKPVTGDPALLIAADTSTNVFPLDGPNIGVAVWSMELGLDILQPFRLSAAGTWKLTNAPPFNFTLTRLQFNRATGAFSGAFDLTSWLPPNNNETLTRSIPFSGQISNAQGSFIGHGVALISDINALTGDTSTTPLHAVSVELRPYY